MNILPVTASYSNLDYESRNHVPLKSCNCGLGFCWFLSKELLDKPEGTSSFTWEAEGRTHTTPGTKDRLRRSLVEWRGGRGRKGHDLLLPSAWTSQVQKDLPSPLLCSPGPRPLNNTPRSLSSSWNPVPGPPWRPVALSGPLSHPQPSSQDSLDVQSPSAMLGAESILELEGISLSRLFCLHRMWWWHYRTGFPWGTLSTLLLSLSMLDQNRTTSSCFSKTSSPWLM